MKSKTLKGLVVLMTAWLVCFGCTKSKDDVVEDYAGKETPGEIPGFGTTGGNIGGKEFTLPDGVVFDGEIMGYESDNDFSLHFNGIKPEKLSIHGNVVSLDEPVRSRAAIKADITLGSGGLVTVLVAMKNTTSNKIDVEFPAGLIFESASGKYQNGILLKKTKATVPAGGKTYCVELQMYCGNASRSASDASAKYLKPVMTNSELLLYLCGLVKNKKINYEENSGLLQIIQYYTMVFRLQMIVWKVTDEGQMPDKSDLDYIADLK